MDEQISNGTLQDLPARYQEWRELLKLDTAEGKQRADELYFKEILGWAIARARQREDSDEHTHGDYDILISLMGMSPETTVIAVALLRPKKLVVILSEKATKSFNAAVGYLVENKYLEIADV